MKQLESFSVTHVELPLGLINFLLLLRNGEFTSNLPKATCSASPRFQAGGFARDKPGKPPGG